MALTPVDPIDEILNRAPTPEELEKFTPEQLANHREYARSLFG